MILLVAAFANGFLLINESTIWDSWYLLAWIRSANFAPMDNFFGSVGIPAYGWLYRPFAAVSNPVAALMFATYCSIVTGGALTYLLIRKLTAVGKHEALAITALALSMPVFNAGQDLSMLFFLVTNVIFLVSALLVVGAMEARRERWWLWMGLGIAGFWFSFCNAALLVFYGAFYTLLFIRFGRTPGVPFLMAGWRFVLRHPLLFLLPPVSWIGRGLLTPQYGWYAHYNSPLANIGSLGPNLWSFLENVPIFHLRRSGEWAVDHPVLIVLLALAAIAWWATAPKRWNFLPGPLATRHLVWSGCLLLFLAIFPFAAAGKHFSATPVGEDSHYFFLVSLPAAILLYAAIRGAICWRHRAQFGRIATPVIGCSVVLLGGQLSHYYVAEQAEWVFNRSLLHLAARNEAVRASSVILLQGVSLAKQCAYGMYGFAMAFDELARFVTTHPPENQQFYTASEIERTVLRTTILPNEFKNIDPSGQQALISAERNRGTATDWDIVQRYQMLRWFGTKQEMDDYLSGLITMKVLVFKPRTPLEVAPTPASPAGESPSTGIPSGSFMNGAGMEMTFLSAGWWAGKFEVTQGQYERVMKVNPSLFKDLSRPVERVSWNDAVEFCHRLTDTERKAGRIPPGFVYRLPTVEEFNQLLAGGSLRDAVTSAHELRWHPAPVGSRPANSLGLHDVVGNVWEWCLDWGDDAKRFRIAAGGAWPNHDWELAPYSRPREGLDPYELAASERLYGPLRRDYPDQGFWDRGFRCVLAPERAATVFHQEKR